MARKKITQKQANKKYKDGTTYTVNGKKRKRKSAKGTKKGDGFCARTNHSKYNTPKGRARRKAWGCKGSKSKK